MENTKSKGKEEIKSGTNHVFKYLKRIWFLLLISLSLETYIAISFSNSGGKVGFQRAATLLKPPSLKHSKQLGLIEYPVVLRLQYAILTR